MSETPTALPTQELAEFLAIVSSQVDAQTAMRAAVQQVALALEAEVAAIVLDGAVACSIGFPAGRIPTDELVAVAAGRSRQLDIPGAGLCTALSASLGGGSACRLVIARSLAGGFSPEELHLARAMARVLDLTLASMRTLQAEQALRRRSEQQAAENADLLVSLRERQRLLEHLARIQRAIAQRAPLQQILDGATSSVRSLLSADMVVLRVVEAGDSDYLALSSSNGVRDDTEGRSLQLRVDEAGIARECYATGQVVVRDTTTPTDAGDVPGPTHSTMAAPVYDNGRVVGSLIVATRTPREEPEADRDILCTFAEHITLAVTDARTLEAMYQAFHDSLTGLASRALFLDRLQHGLKSAARSKTQVGLLFIDLDRFKMVNDTLGHAAGDLLLVEVAERVRRCLRASDTAARFGGDEFAVIMQGSSEIGAAAAADRIIEVVSQPYVVGGREVFVNASIGIALSDATLMDAHELLRAADVAMYQAKRNGKGRHQRFDPSMHEVLMDRLEMEADLRRAIDGGEFVLHYQPIVTLDTRRVVAVEALVRWNHPRRGMVPPLDFIPMAEETGLILRLGQWVLEEACRQAARWQSERPASPPLSVTVNLSARQLEQADIADRVSSALSASGLAPACLVLELTESLLLQDAAGTIAKLHALKALGVRLAIDDFGTGYSSLSYLRRFPVDILKIDKSFVDGIGTGADESAFARAIVRLGLTLRLQMIAEGIEDATQLAELRSAHCQLGQGYYFSRPLPAAQLTELLAGTVKDRAEARLPALPLPSVPQPAVPADA